MFQTSSSRDDAQQPPDPVDVGAGDLRHSLYHGFRFHLDAEGRPVTLRHPIVDLTGQPIVDREGRGIGCRLPTRRRWNYEGSPEARASWIRLARRAGQAMESLPAEAVTWLPLETREASDPEYRWLWAVFDLAWQGRHPSLRAERRTWFRLSSPIPEAGTDIIYVPYDLDTIRHLQQDGSGPLAELPEAWTERLPGYFLSELPDICEASADLVDIFLEEESPPEDGWFSCRQLASRFRVDYEALRKRLDRYRRRNPDCYRELEPSERRVRESRYLYRLKSVLEVVQSLQRKTRPNR